MLKKPLKLLINILQAGWSMIVPFYVFISTIKVDLHRTKNSLRGCMVYFKRKLVRPSYAHDFTPISPGMNPTLITSVLNSRSEILEVRLYFTIEKVSFEMSKIRIFSG